MLYFLLSPAFILILAAVIPAAFLLRYIYRSDKLDRESPQILTGLVLRGILATFGAIVTEQLGSMLLDALRIQSEILYNALMNFLVVALSEEGFKYVLLRRRTWNSPEFNCQYDGVVYAVFVSLGFALWENISYVLQFGLTTALLRAVTAVPGHACFGVFMGAFYGLARRYYNFGDWERSRRCRRLAVIVPVLLHGAYDFIAGMNVQGYAWFFAVFVALLFLMAHRMVRTLSRDDRFIDGDDGYWETT